MARQGTRYQASKKKVKVGFTDLSLTRRQWMALFITGALVIGIEIRNHAHMWLAHGSGQTFWTDHELKWEIAIFGILIPIVLGVVLGRLGRTAVERDRIGSELALRREMVALLREARDWSELADRVVTMPDIVAAADRAWLLAQLPGEQQLDLFAQWVRPDKRTLAASAPVSPVVCEQCVAALSARRTGTLICLDGDAGIATPQATRHCLRLSSEYMRKAVLLFDVPSDCPLGPGQIELLNDLGREMSLAIDSADLNYLEKRQVDAVKNERLRIGRDLHDTLGQNIAYLHLKLEQLSVSQLVTHHPEFQKEFASLVAVADEAYEQVRKSLDELRMAGHGSLAEVIRSYADQAAARAGYSVHTYSTGLPTALSPRQTRQILYVVRETLNNIEKHASAHHVSIHLNWRDDQFRLAVRDDGVGFHFQELERGDGYGLAIMGERARTINARLAVKSAPGDGTEVTLRLPLSSTSCTTQGNQ